MINSLENENPNPVSVRGSIPVNDGSPPSDELVGRPGREMEHDPAATRHAPLTEHERIYGKSKYESAEPYKSKKGDRFS